MGLFDSFRKTAKHTKEIMKDWDPADDMKQGMSNMKAASATMGSNADMFRLRNEGVKAKGKIVEMNETGMDQGGAPIIDFKVLLEREGVAPYEAQVTRALQPGEKGVFVPGMDLNVFVDKDDPHRFIF